MKRVLITGASRGIGAAVARELAGRGASLALHCNRSVARAEELRAALPGVGHTVLAADLGDPSTVAQLFADAVSALGGLDGLVIRPPLRAPRRRGPPAPANDARHRNGRRAPRQNRAAATV